MLCNMDTGSESIDLFDSSAAEFSDAEESDVSGVDVSKTYPMALSTQKMRPFMSEKGKRYKSYESKNESPAASEIGPTPTGQPKLKKNPRYTPTGQLKLKKNPRSLQYSLSSGESSAAVLSALGDLTNTLTKVVKRLEKTESRILSMEEKIGSNMSSSSSTEHQPYHKPRRVPVVVRVSTTHIYKKFPPIQYPPSLHTKQANITTRMYNRTARGDINQILYLLLRGLIGGTLQ